MPIDFALPTSGSDPIMTSRERLEEAVQKVVDELEEQIGAVATSLSPVGSWDADSGSFPAGAVYRTYYLVNNPGVTDGVAFNVGDWLIPKKTDASTTDFSDWIVGQYGRTETQEAFDQFAQSQDGKSFEDRTSFASAGGLVAGQSISIEGRLFRVVESGTYAANGATVFNGAGIQAVMEYSETLPGFSAFLGDTRPNPPVRTVFRIDEPNLAYIYRNDGLEVIPGKPGWRPVAPFCFEHFGAVGDGVTDDADAIQDAIDGLRSLGENSVTGLARVYSVESSREFDDAGRRACIVMPPKIHMQGNFLIKRTAAQTGIRAVIAITGGVGGSIRGEGRGIEIDTNDAVPNNDTPGIHGVFKHRQLEDYTIENVTIRNSSDYNLGLQDEDGVNGFGFTQNCVFRNLRLYNSGDDGLDIKDNDSQGRTRRNLFENILVDGYALDPARSGRTGLHIRGDETTVRGVTVRNPGPAAAKGIAIQTVDNNNPPLSVVLTDFRVNVASVSNCNGLVVDSSATEVRAGNIQVGAGGSAIVLGGGATGLTVDGVTGVAPSRDGANGFIAGSSTNANVIIANSRMTGFDISWYFRGADSHLSTCRSNDARTYHVRVSSASNGCTMVGGSLRGAAPTNGAIDDNVGDLIIRGVAGVADRN